MTYNDSTLGHVMVTKLPFPATIVRGHPLSEDVWAISHKNELSIFSAQHVNDLEKRGSPPSRYIDFALHLNFNDNVADFAFSSDGALLAVVNEADCTIGVFKLPQGASGVSSIHRGQGEVEPFSTISSSSPCSGLAFMPNNSGDVTCNSWSLLTLTSAKDSMLLSAHKITPSEESTIQQQVHIHLPRHASGTTDVLSITLDSAGGQYAIITNSSCYAVACVALNHGASSAGMPFYHCTFLDLKLPVTSVLAGTMFLQDGANEGQAPHVVVTCMQDQLSNQLAVKQYNVPCDWVQPKEPPVQAKRETRNDSVDSTLEAEILNLVNLDDSYSGADEGGAASKNTETADNMGHNVIKGVVSPPTTDAQEQPIAQTSVKSSDEPTEDREPSTPPTTSISLPTAPSPLSGGTAGISFISSDTTLPPGAFPDFAVKKEGSAKPGSTVTVASGSTSSLPSDSVDIGVKSKNLLLSALKSKPVAAEASMRGTSDGSNGPSSIQEAKLPVKTETRGPPVIPFAKPKNEDASYSSSNVEGSQGKSRKIPVDLNALMGGTESTLKVAAVVQEVQAQEPGTPEIKVDQQQKRKSTREEDEDEWEIASQTISNSQQNTPKSVPEKQLTKDVIGVDKITLETVNAKVNNMARMVQSLHDKATSKTKSADLSTKNIVDLRAHIVQDVLKGVEKQMLGTVKAMAEKQSQQAVAKILGSEQWREELSNQISSDLRTELGPFISQSSKDAVRDSVKDNLRPTLVKSFRAAFEATIIPAYQAGAQEMFQQMQQTFDTGMQAMMAHSKAVHDAAMADNENLKQEVAELRSSVHVLETRLHDMSRVHAEALEAQTATILAALKSGLTSSSIPRGMQTETDHVVLFKEGRIAESLEVALEGKDVENVIWILKKQQEDTGSIGALLETTEAVPLLCTAQQLAANLSKSEPSEGFTLRIEWLKEIIMHLLPFKDDLRGGISNSTGHSLSTVVAMILGSLGEAETLHGTSIRRTDMRMLCSVLKSSF
eukprot:CAMPEP_0185032118 /NCGR_PEP_ID=MMETSP1103-20130426/19987_1 /TAXON_ID=36769 /ORGANISM="Paraphysomonas bandaiensis, Strain Caron Lab Isolate" /LENGTH=1001 /DNA_ID=CAMNT_0027567893 /DNA_START=336 /DNA_END=3341 /DNA_ORIENTATION=-